MNMMTIKYTHLPNSNCGAMKTFPRYLAFCERMTGENIRDIGNMRPIFLVLIVKPKETNSKDCMRALISDVNFRQCSLLLDLSS